ncbi:MAG: CAP domain-containing protein [Myxococcaceae bacterium]|nr:CAP domain-containing protein [Myxococcaceae bacterium]
MRAARFACWVLTVGLSSLGCGEGAATIEADEGDGAALNDELADATSTSAEQGLNTPVLDTEEVAFLKLINDYRASKGLVKLRASVALTRAANAHSADMAATGKFQHNSSDGTDTFVRIAKYYACSGYKAENIAMGASDAQTVFTLWKNSAPHNTNMLGADYRVIGISRVPNASGTMYWTTDFGSCVDALFSAGFGTIASNGGFESTDIVGGVDSGAVRTLSKWHTGGSAGSAFTRGTGAMLADGSYGMRATDPDPGHSAVTQVVRGSANINYRARATARRVSGATQQVLYLDFLDANLARLAVKTTPAPATSTAGAFFIDGVSPAGTRYVRVILYGGGAAGQRSVYDWDAVRLEAW